MEDALLGLGVLGYLILLIFMIVWVLLPFYVRRIAIESKHHTKVLKAIHKLIKKQNSEQGARGISQKDVDDFLNEKK